MLPSSMTVVIPARRRRHSISCNIVVNCENMIDLCDALSERSLCRSWTRSSILDDEVQSAILIRLIMDDFLTNASSCSICNGNMLRGCATLRLESLDTKSIELDVYILKMPKGK